jgi:hypothetical protein
MTQRSDAQMAAMSAEDLRKALRAMLVYPLPDDEALDPPHKLAAPDKWGGRVIVWVKSGDRLAPDAKAINRALGSGAAVLTAELPDAPPNATRVKRGTYAGYVLGYNRSSLAQQAVAVLRLIETARKLDGVKSIDLLGAGPAVLLARATTDAHIGNTVIDLDGFDLDQIKDPSDPRMLPGGLKYGGVLGFARLCTGGRTTLVNAPRAATIEGVTVLEAPPDAAGAVERLLQ